MASFEKEVLLEVGALAVGAVQPFVLRQYADTKFGTLIPQLGVYGTPSALAGIIGGGAATAAALVGMFMNKGLTDPLYQKVALAYGVPALVGSITMAALTQTVSANASAQAVFRPNAGPAPVGSQSPAQRNLASLTPAQRASQSVL